LVLIGLLAGPAGRAERGQGELWGLIEQAAALKAQGKYSECIQTLRTVVSRAQEDRAAGALAQCRLGECYLAMALPVRAEAELKKVTADFPEQADAIAWSRVALIDAYAFQGKPEAALAVFEQIQQAHAAGQATDKQFAWASVKAGDILARQGRTADAWAVLDPVTKLGLADVGPKVAVGVKLCEMLIAQGRLYDAAERLADLIETAKDKYPGQCNWARVRLAEVWEQTGRHGKAIQVAEEVVADHAAGRASDEQVARALLWKARALMSQGQFEPAIEALQIARAVGTQSAPVAYEVLFTLGEAYRRWGDQDKAHSGPRHVEALGYYQAALAKAQQAKLGEELQDRARLQVGSEMRHLGMRERGIAWLRMGIEDPAILDGTDRLLAERLASFLTASEREAWAKYLLSPKDKPDPTAGFVQAEFKTGVPQPSQATVQDAWQRYHWLGRLYEQQERYPEAIEAYQRADATAQTAQEHARALCRLARCQRHGGARAEALATADRAADFWLIAIREGTPQDAHEAIDKALQLYWRLGEFDKPFALAQRFVAMIDAEKEPSKAVFAEYMLVGAYISKRRFAEAGQHGEAVCAKFSKYGDADIRWICAKTLQAAFFGYYYAGDMDAASRVVDQLESLQGERFAKHITGFREDIERHRQGLPPLHVLPMK